MIIALENFRDEEFINPKLVFDSNNIKVTTASLRTGTAKGKFGLFANIDITLKEVDITNYDAIIYIGGAGCKSFWDNLDAQLIAKKAIETNKILAAICSAPVTLARAGLLRGITSTCYAGDKEELKIAGANYTGNPIEQDGLIITADGPKAATAFGLKIVETLNKQLEV